MVKQFSIKGVTEMSDKKCKKEKKAAMEENCCCQMLAQMNQMMYQMMHHMMMENHMPCEHGMMEQPMPNAVQGMMYNPMQGVPAYPGQEVAGMGNYMPNVLPVMPPCPGMVGGQMYHQMQMPMPMSPISKHSD